jgi:hypothetical protein
MPYGLGEEAGLGEASSNIGTRFGGVMSDKVASIVSDVRELMSTEFGRVFPNFGAPTGWAPAPNGKLCLCLKIILEY